MIDNFPISLPSPDTLKAPSQRRTLRLSELFKEEKVLEADYELGMTSNIPVEERNRRKVELLRMRIEIVERMVLPLAVLAVSFVAAPLAVRAERGGRSYSFAIGFVIVLTYYLLRALLEPTSLKPMSEVVLRAILPVILFSAIGIWATWRVDRV